MRPWIVLIVVCGFCGCARFKSQPLTPAESAAQLDHRGLDDAGLKQFLELNLGRQLDGWPLPAWDLKSLTLAAYYFHPSLAVARTQWQVSQAGVKTAGGRLNPTLIFTPGYDTTSMPNLSPWLPIFSVDIPLETAGKRGKRIAEATQLTQAAWWNMVTVAWQIRSAVRAGLLEVAVADRRVTLLEKQLAAQEQTMKLLRQRVAAGAVAPADLTSAQIILDRAQLDFADAKSARAQTRAQLAQDLGLSGAALAGVNLGFDFSQKETGELTSAEARKYALCGRADIRNALANYAAAEADLRLQIAKQYPDIHFSPGYQYNQGDNQWLLGITVELPMLNRNEGPIAEAEARRVQAAAQFTELQAKIIGQLDLAIAAYGARRENLATLQSLAAAHNTQRQSTEQLYKAGVAEQSDVLGADVESAAAALLELDAQAKFQQALGALEDAVQQPLDRDIQPVPETALTAKPKVQP